MPELELKARKGRKYRYGQIWWTKQVEGYARVDLGVLPVQWCSKKTTTLDAGETILVVGDNACGISNTSWTMRHLVVLGWRQ